MAKMSRSSLQSFITLRAQAVQLLADAIEAEVARHPSDSSEPFRVAGDRLLDEALDVVSGRLGVKR
jgi:hypothetical protein